MPLSLQLGQLLVSLHEGLFCSVHQETNPGVLVCSLRSLSVLVGAAPYERLPVSLLPRALKSARSCLARLKPKDNPASESGNAAAWACIAAVFSTKKASPAILEELQNDVDDASPDVLPCILQELSRAACASSSAVCTEALSGFLGAVKNYPSVMRVGGAPAAAALMFSWTQPVLILDMDPSGRVAICAVGHGIPPVKRLGKKPS